MQQNDNKIGMSVDVVGFINVDRITSPGIVRAKSWPFSFAKKILNGKFFYFKETLAKIKFIQGSS